MPWKIGENDTIFGYQRYPKFEIGKPRFPQDTFSGRFLHFLDIIDFRTLLVGDERLQRALDLLEKFETGELPPDIRDEDLWEAKKLKQAIIHPDTGEKIFLPFRMSGYIPFGTLIVLGVLWPNPSMKQTVFFQWLNQSNNACVNFSNRNASKPTPTSKFLQGYAAAVTSAVGISVGLTVLLKRTKRLPTATRDLIQRFVPTPAICTASTLNSLCMRWHERTRGVEVFDSNGNEVGISCIAAKRVRAYALFTITCAKLS